MEGKERSKGGSLKIKISLLEFSTPITQTRTQPQLKSNVTILTPPGAYLQVHTQFKQFTLHSPHLSLTLEPRIVTHGWGPVQAPVLITDVVMDSECDIIEWDIIQGVHDEQPGSEKTMEWIKEGALYCRSRGHVIDIPRLAPSQSIAWQCELAV